MVMRSGSSGRLEERSPKVSSDWRMPPPMMNKASAAPIEYHGQRWAGR
jgi:hypothetical protein